MDWVLPRSTCDMMTISFIDLGSSLRGKIPLANWLPYYALDCLAREMLRSLRKSGEQKRCYGIYFTFTPPCGPLVPSPLEAFHSMLFNSASFQFVSQRGG